MRRFFLVLSLAGCVICSVEAGDHFYELQSAAIEENRADFGHWGSDSEDYTQWGSHSNRLIPVYTFGTRGKGKGIDLRDYRGKNSLYRDEAKIRDLYGKVPEATLNEKAYYFDQTDIFRIQLAALESGKKNIFLVVFDGMDWQTTRAASIAKLNKVAYESGRGTGLHFQDYRANRTTQFGFVVTSPYVNEANVDVNSQTAQVDLNSQFGGYAWKIAGRNPWMNPKEPTYLLGKVNASGIRHAYTDSASSATSLCAGIKTYNAAINVDSQGARIRTIAHLAQDQGYKIGIVTSVPISHATPASAYAHNVKRHDYQDLTNDLLGVKSVSHSEKPLRGVDVLLGAGYGETKEKDAAQGDNFVSGNTYLTAETLKTVDHSNSGKYVVVQRESDRDGGESLAASAKQASENGHRLFGYFGVKKGHLPFQTADGDYQPPRGRSKTAEKYSPGDIKENPTLAEMTRSALAVLETGDNGIWMLVESGDVDWANHDNNLDNSIGAVFSGDDAVKEITDWVEQYSSWDESILIVTADHGHFLVLEQPELLVEDEAK